MSLAPCIFCRCEECERTREHVLQAGLGESLTLPREVCAGCNAAFSSLDKDLIEHVNLFALGRASSLLGIGLQEDSAAGVRLTARRGTNGDEKDLSVLLTQLFCARDGSWHFRGSSPEALQVMAKELSRPCRKVSEAVDADVEGELPTALAIVRTAPGSFMVRGADAAAVGALATTLREKGVQVDIPDNVEEEAPEPSLVPPIKIKTSFPVGRIARCLAKVALNFVCSLFGTWMALDPAFDPLRRFARHGEGNFVEFVNLAIFDDGLEEAVRAYAHPTRHALVLNQIQKDSRFLATVQVILYGKAVGLVRLATAVQPLFPLGTWRVSYFDPALTAFEHFVVPQDGLRCFVNIEAVVPQAPVIKCQLPEEPQ